MPYNPAIHHRQSTRLRGYDYAQAGAYFVTMVAQRRESRFGVIVGEEMQLNAAGEMVTEEWGALPERFPAMDLDVFIVMPNHMHGIIVISDDESVESVGATTRVAPTVAPRAGTSPAPTDEQPMIDQRPTLGGIVGAFKSITTNHYIDGVHELGWPPFKKRIWQRNYHDHIIRDEAELNRIRAYILNNPRQWALDNENLLKGKA